MNPTLKSAKHTFNSKVFLDSKQFLHFKKFLMSPRISTPLFAVGKFQ